MNETTTTLTRAGCDVDTAGIPTLCKLSDLIATLGQHREEAVLLLFICVNTILGGIKQLSRALDTEFEARFGEVARIGHGLDKDNCSNPSRDTKGHFLAAA
jgi:hypothetical protein